MHTSICSKRYVEDHDSAVVKNIVLIAHVGNNYKQI